MRSFDFFSKFIIIGVLLFALLSFNWDRTEMENRAFVVAIGIDAGNSGERFEVSMSIADVAAMEGEGGAEDVAILRVAAGQSLACAMGQINAKISDTVYYGHTKAIVLGESILTDEGLLREVVDTLSRKNDINIKCIVMTADGHAKDILEAKPREQSLLGVYLSGFYNSHNVNTAASVVKLDLEGLTDNLRDTACAVIPKVAIEDEEVVISGVAVLKDFTLAGYIPDEGMAGFLWLMENAAGAQVAVNDAAGAPITLLVQQSKSKFSFAAAGDHLLCTIKLRAEGSIEGARFMDDQLYDAQTMRQLQSDYADKIREEVKAILHVFQSDFGVDSFNLRNLLHKKDHRLFQAHLPWQEAFESMVFSVDVDVLIRNAGPVK